MKKYSVIYCDPPWQFKNKKTGGSMKSGAANQYRVTSIQDLMNIDVANVAADDCILFMWWVGSMPQEAIDLVGAWGFTLKNMNGIVWRKLTKKMLPFFGMGFYTRAGSESMIIAIKGKGSRLIKNRSVRAVIAAKVEGHSVKPQIFRDTIVKLTYGDNLNKLEMFARKSERNWDVFGDQAENSIFIRNKNDIY